MSKNRIVFLFSCIFLLLFLIFRVSYQPGSDNDLSRLGGIIAIARYNELNIDRTVQLATDDKVRNDEKYYSSKPPLLNVILGKTIRLAFLLYKPALLDNDVAIYRVSTMLAVVFPLCGIYVLFYILISSSLNISSVRSVFFSLFLVLGTLLFAYSRYLTNHVLEAFIQLSVFILLLKGFEGNGAKKTVLLGFLLSVLLALDITYGIIAIPVTVIYLWIRERARFIKFLPFLCAGLIPVVVFHFILSYMQFGILFPPQLFPEKYLSYEGSKWVGTLTGMLALNESLIIRIFNYSFGTYGFFLYQPLLILPFLVREDWKDLLFKYITVILLVYMLFNAVMQADYGGSSYGPRRFLPLIPLFYFYVVKEVHSFRKDRKWRILAVTLFIVNFLFSFLGYVNTWGNWDFFMNYSSNKRLYFPLLFTIRDVLSSYKLDWIFTWMY